MSLLQLPTELIQDIGIRLTDQELVRLRLVSRKLAHVIGSDSFYRLVLAKKFDIANVSYSIRPDWFKVLTERMTGLRLRGNYDFHSQGDDVRVALKVMQDLIVGEIFHALLQFGQAC